MKGLFIVGVFGFVGYLLSFGLFVPDELKSFHILGAAGSMAGYSLGETTKARVQSPWALAALTLVSFVSVVVTTLWYTVSSQLGQAGAVQVGGLGILLSLLFFSFAYLMPLAGVAVGSKAEVPPSTDTQHSTTS
jgi:hypothetical protein